MEESYKYIVVDMEKKEDTPRKKTIVLPTPDTEWKEKKTKKGQRMFYRKYRGKYINVGFLKTGHVWLSYDGAFVKDHKIKYTDDTQLKNDVDELLDLIVNIAN